MNITLKDKILSLSQEKIYSMYFDIPIHDITWSTIHNSNKLHNPFRQDNDPSLSFRWFGNKLIVRDWGDSTWNGDVFKIVGYILNNNCFINDQFVFICNDILERYYNGNKRVVYNEEYDVIRKAKVITTIDTKTRLLQKRDYNFYNQFCIVNKTVDTFVNSVMRYSVNDVLTGYRNAYKDPCYQYTVNHYFTKLYFPNRHHKSVYPRFVTNNVLQIDDITDIIPSQDKLLVKSIKDKMLCLQLLDSLSISQTDIAIHTASSETETFKSDILSLLRSNTKYNIYSLFDSDKTGLKSMQELERTCNIQPIIFSNDAKDPTDYARDFGYGKTINTFKSVILQIHSNRTNFINPLII